jgi:sigma-54 specific flagellar transcriptional regulator A
MAAQIHSLRTAYATRNAQDAAPATALAQVGQPTGTSQGARRVREQVAQVARFNTTVLVLGESGTGKEVVARHLHALSDRADRPFVPVNCGAIPADLLESELFGHEKGAFTGAVNARQGRFEVAEGGTLFLDEIGEMSPHMQVKLLRVLQSRSYERVGCSESRATDVRIIAATNRDLENEVREGRFREDLYFRLNVFPIEMPALRDRVQDLPALIDTFSNELELRGHAPVRFAPDALATLAAYAWPGNIRELENLLERLSVTHAGATVSAQDLPERYRRDNDGTGTHELAQIVDVGGSDDDTGCRVVLPQPGLCLKSVLATIERDLIVQALGRSGGVVSRAARSLNLGRTTLLEKMRKLQLVRGE